VEPQNGNSQISSSRCERVILLDSGINTSPCR
jgi:hypothetical protein